VIRFGKRLAIAIGGGLVILVGAAMLVLPGPGLVVIALGLAILALEFERPRIWLEHMKDTGKDLKHRFDAVRARRRDRN